jgi:hypothetical protein
LATVESRIPGWHTSAQPDLLANGVIVDDGLTKDDFRLEERSIGVSHTDLTRSAGRMTINKIQTKRHNWKRDQVGTTSPTEVGF